MCACVCSCAWGGACAHAGRGSVCQLGGCLREGTASPEPLLLEKSFLAPDGEDSRPSGVSEAGGGLGQTLWTPASVSSSAPAPHPRARPLVIPSLRPGSLCRAMPVPPRPGPELSGGLRGGLGKETQRLQELLQTKVGGSPQAGDPQPEGGHSISLSASVPHRVNMTPPAFSRAEHALPSPLHRTFWGPGAPLLWPPSPPSAPAISLPASPRPPPPPPSSLLLPDLPGIGLGLLCPGLEEA